VNTTKDKLHEAIANIVESHIHTPEDGSEKTEKLILINGNVTVALGNIIRNDEPAPNHAPGPKRKRWLLLYGALLVAAAILGYHTYVLARYAVYAVRASYAEEGRYVSPHEERNAKS
jgi:hypothetical protein